MKESPRIIGNWTAAALLAAVISAALALPGIRRAAADEGSPRTFSLGPLTLHVDFRPLRFSVLEGGKPLLAERTRLGSSSIGILDGSGWRPALDLISIRGDVSAGPDPAARVALEAASDGGALVKLAIEWSAAGGALEISYESASCLALRDDFITPPDEPLLHFESPAASGAESRSIILSRTFAIVAGGGGAGPARDGAKRPAAFQPDPDTLRIEAAGASMLLRLLPGPPRETLARLRPREASGAERVPLLWIETGSRPSSDEEGAIRRILEESRSLGSAAPGRSAGLVFQEGGAAAFKLLDGSAPARPPVTIPIRDWKSLREAAASAVESAAVGARPRVVQLPPAGSEDRAAELWARAFALAALQPAMAVPAELAAECGGPPGVERPGERARIARRLLRVRALLGAELAGGTEATGGSSRGLTPLFVEHPGEKEAWKAWDEWLLGRDILVAPILGEGERERSVWFPPGKWLDLGPGSREPRALFAGPGRSTVEIPPGEIGIFARDGGDGDLARSLAEALRTERG